MQITASEELSGKREGKTLSQQVTQDYKQKDVCKEDGNMTLLLGVSKRALRR